MKDDPRWKFFKCQRCGRCCNELGLPYDRDSVLEISERFNIPVKEVIERYYGEVVSEGKPWELQNEKGIPCPFLINDGEKYSCKIYDIRPFGCKMYPLATDAGCQDVDCPAYINANVEYEKKCASKDKIND